MSMYLPWVSSEGALAEVCREKIRSIRNIIELIDENNPTLKVSEQGPADLRVPILN